ncbi:MAG: MATE family efflux transporter [Candidatus Woesearchaeota archaeon]
MNKKLNEIINNPKKSLFKLSIPIMLAMSVQILYNIVDTAFVGRLGSESIAALTFSLPIFFIIIGISIGLGTGVSSLIARQIGANEIKNAKKTAINGFIIAIFCGITFTIIGLIFIEPLLTIFGVDKNIMPLALSYLKIILYSTIFFFMVGSINAIINGQGLTKYSTIIQIFGLITNIILDPILIYTLNYGVEGAAIATLISVSLSMVLGIIIIYKVKKIKIKINFKKIDINKKIIKAILKVGFPTMIVQLLFSSYVLIINRFMSKYGVDYVSSMGLVYRLESVSIMPVIAVSIGMLTMVGMYFGAKQKKLIKEIINYSLKISINYMLFLGIILFFFSQFFFKIFTNEPQLLNLASNLMKINVFTFPLIATIILISKALQAMGDGISGLIIISSRIIIIFIPLSYLFVNILQLNYLSVAIAMVISAIISTIIAIFLLNKNYKKLNLID